MKNNNLKKGLKKKTYTRKKFPEMFWLGDKSLYQKAIFIKDYDDYIFVLDELSTILYRDIFI